MRACRVLQAVKTFLKIVVLVIVAIIAVKFLPLIFGLGCMLAAAVMGVIAVAASTIAALVGSALVLAVLLSPIWIPVLLLFALIAVIKRSTRKTGGIVA